MLLEKQSRTNVFTLVLNSQLSMESSCQPNERIRLVRKKTSSKETWCENKIFVPGAARSWDVIWCGGNCHGCKKASKPKSGQNFMVAHISIYG